MTMRQINPSGTREPITLDVDDDDVGDEEDDDGYEEEDQNEDEDADDSNDYDDLMIGDVVVQ